MDCKQTLMSYRKEPSLIEVLGSRALQDIFGYMSECIKSLRGQQRVEGLCAFISINADGYTKLNFCLKSRSSPGHMSSYLTRV